MRHFVLSFCICCSFLLSVGNRFLVSIQQHKMSLSGGRESDEYIHLHSAALCSALSVCLCVLTHVCVHLLYIFMNVPVYLSLLLHGLFFFLHVCVSLYEHACMAVHVSVYMHLLVLVT